VTRRIELEWPDPSPFRDREGAPIRLLVVSDTVEQTLLDGRNREAIGSIDLIVGCGDLDFKDLSYIADRFDAPLVFVHGNHDAPDHWADAGTYCPEPLQSTAVRHLSGLAFAGLTWPGKRGKGATRSERTAWNQALRLATRRIGRTDPLIVISHVPPLGAGDVADGYYHRGFRGYRWLMEHLAPPLWLHGHTPLAATADWHIQVGRTTLVNATGAVVIELLPPKLAGTGDDAAETTAHRAKRLPPGNRKGR
jgi:Icc-related predicted phosphoesterase